MDTLLLVLIDVPAALVFVALGLGLFVLDLFPSASSTGNSWRGTDGDEGRHLG